MINESQAKQYCREDITLIKNYAEAIADNTKTWICHHVNGEPFTGFCKADLKKMNMYYQRPASELKFVTRSEHTTIHNKVKKGKRCSENTRKKISAANTGKTSPNKGKYHSEETRKKISDSHKGKHLSDEHRQKLSESLKGRTFSEETIKKLSKSHKGMIGKHHSEETRKKIAESHKGKHHSEETKKKISESKRIAKCL